MFDRVFGKLHLLLAGLLLAGSAAQGDVADLPQDLQDWLHEVGPIYFQDFPGNTAKSFEYFTPLLKTARSGGVTVTKDLSYGSDPLQELDLYREEGIAQAPIIVFVHGGGYTGGSRDYSSEVHANVLTFFARHGMLGVNIDYRLAPAARWPSGARDVSAAVSWLKENAAQFGGDSNNITLMGHSAGATHVARFAFDKAMQPQRGPGISGVVLMSGRYRVTAQAVAQTEYLKAYFGADAQKYPARSSINLLEKAPHVPTFIVIAEYDAPGLDVIGAELFASLCARDSVCPRFRRLDGHNHMSMVYHFNTTDDSLGRQVLDFVRRRR